LPYRVHSVPRWNGPAPWYNTSGPRGSSHPSPQGPAIRLLIQIWQLQTKLTIFCWNFDKPRATMFTLHWGIFYENVHISSKSLRLEERGHPLIFHQQFPKPPQQRKCWCFLCWGGWEMLSKGRITESTL
jgi:hypothetical protein